MQDTKTTSDNYSINELKALRLAFQVQQQIPIDLKSFREYQLPDLQFGLWIKIIVPNNVNIDKLHKSLETIEGNVVGKSNDDNDNNLYMFFDVSNFLIKADNQTLVFDTSKLVFDAPNEIWKQTIQQQYSQVKEIGTITKDPSKQQVSVQVRTNDLKYSDLRRLVIDELKVNDLNRTNEEWIYKISGNFKEYEIKFPPEFDNVKHKIYRFRFSKKLMKENWISENNLDKFINDCNYKIVQPLPFKTIEALIGNETEALFRYMYEEKSSAREFLKQIKANGVLKTNEANTWTIEMKSPEGVQMLQKIFNKLDIHFEKVSDATIKFSYPRNPWILFLQMFAPIFRGVQAEYIGANGQYHYSISTTKLKEIGFSLKTFAQVFDRTELFKIAEINQPNLNPFTSAIVGEEYIESLLSEEKLSVEKDINYISIESKLQQGVSPLEWICQNFDVFFHSPIFKPRKLTLKEREMITDYVYNEEPLRSATEETRKQMESEQKDFLKGWLTEIDITPLAIMALRENISNRRINALVEPGLTVGILASEALGGPITQATLNSFHSAGGSRSITRSIQTLKEYISKAGPPKNIISSIHFKNKEMTTEEILNLKQKLVEVTLLHLIDKEKYPVLASMKDIKEESWWQESYLQLKGSEFKKEIETSLYGMRIYFDVDLLYMFRISTEDIAQYLESNSGKLFDKPEANLLRCIPSPNYLGVVDVIPFSEIGTIAKKEFNFDNKETNEFFLRMTVLTMMYLMKFSGLAGIKNIFPKKVRTLSVKQREEKIEMKSLQTSTSNLATSTNNNTLYKIFFDPIKITISGIDVEKIKTLYERCGFNIVEVFEEEYMTVSPPSIFSTIEMKTNKKFKSTDDFINTVTEEIQKTETQMKPFYKGFLDNKAGILKAIDYNYAEGDGSNLSGLLQLDYIDDRCTISNNPYEIFQLFGIEATTNFLLRELVDIVNIRSSDTYTDPRHIRIFVNFMTIQGSVFPVSFSGLSKQQIGPFASATLRDAMKTFDNVHAFGRRELNQNLSSRIYSASRMKMGTGAVELHYETDKFLESIGPSEEEKKYSKKLMPTSMKRTKTKDEKQRETIMEEKVEMSLKDQDDMFPELSSEAPMVRTMNPIKTKIKAKLGSSISS